MGRHMMEQARLQEEHRAKQEAVETRMNAAREAQKKYRQAENEEREEAVSRNAKLQTASHVINALGGVASAGASDSSVIRGIAQLLPLLGPAGAIGGALFNIAALGREKEETEGEQRLRLFRSGGNESRRAYHEYTSMSMAGSETFGWKPGSMQALGLTNQDVAHIVEGLVKTGSLAGLWDVAKLQAGYGMGDQATGLFNAMKNNGQEGSREALAQVIGVHIANGMERGRFGQSFEMMTRILQSSISGQVDLAEAAKTLQFIGGAGERFKGNTPSSNAMLGSLEQMASGQGGGAQGFFSLMAGGLGKGKSYWEASLSASKGLNKQGGISTADLMDTYIGQRPEIVSAWKSGNRAYAAGMLAMLSGQTPAMAESMLEAYFAGGGRKDVTAGRGGQINDVIDSARIPEADREKVDASNRSQWLLNREAYYGDKSNKAYNSQGNTALDNTSPVGSIGEFEQRYGESNYGSARSNVIEGGEYKKGERSHDAQDMYFPPGTVVRLAVGGTVKSSGQAMKDSRYGFFLEIDGDDGRCYRYVHLESLPSWSVGTRLEAGTSIGKTVTARTFPGGSKSHLHFAVTDKAGRPINPYKALGVEGLNRLTNAPGGSSGGDQAPAASSPSAAPTGDDRPSSLEPAPGPLSSNSRGSAQRMGLDIRIYDNRIDVTERASNSPTGPGYLVQQGVG
jgi:hypothetical protein